MPCFYPLTARKTLQGEIVIKKRDDLFFVSNLKLPCGRCIGCRMEHGRQWAVRALHESQMHSANCALTLTYGDQTNYEETFVSVAGPDLSTPRRVDNREDARELTTIAPKGLEGPNIARVDNSRSRHREGDYELSKRDHQLFMKSLRDRVGPVRFFMCGEYGEKLGRPHYHYVIFGYDFPDKKYQKKSLSGTKLYRSKLLDSIWQKGHAWIGDVTIETCAYIANYVTKKVTGTKADEHYRRTDEAGNDYWLQPEFGLMSRRPGIAAAWWEKYHNDVTTQDAVILRGGIESKPPRYYDKLLQRRDPAKMEATKAARAERAKLQEKDNTPRRLKDKETVQIARHNLKRRQLEK